MKRRVGFRPRREFRHLEAKLDPDYYAKSWRQFLDFLETGEVGTGSYAEHFRLADRIRRAHARRCRYNLLRRAKRLKAVIALARPEYAIYIWGNFLGDLSEGGRWVDLLRDGLLTDRRLARKFFDRMEAVRESVFPASPPWLIVQERARLEAAAEPVADPIRSEFEKSLLPAEAVDAPVNVRPFAQPANPEDAQDTPAKAARAAS